MQRRWALICLAVAAPGLAGAGLVGGEQAALIFAVLSVVITIALAFVGASRGSGRTSRMLTRGLLGLGLWLIACFVALWWWRDGQPSQRILGLPWAMAIQVYGIFLVPLPIVVWLYALTFQSDGIREADLEALRRGSAEPAP